VKKIQEEIGNLEAIKEELKAISQCQSSVDRSLGAMSNSVENKISSIMTILNEIEVAQHSSYPGKRTQSFAMK
jgi:hypothetical protein